MSTSTWCRSAVNRSVFPCLAACRTRPSACVTRARPWVRSVLCRFAFPLVPGLGSTGSAPGCPGLFVGFTATMPGSDFSRSFIGGFGSSPSRRGPTDHRGHRPIRRSPGSRTRNVRTCQGLGPRRARQALAMTRLSVSPSDYSTPSAPGICNVRGSMAGLCAPLPTLRRRPRGRPRTARGRCGSLLLHGDELSPSVPCQSPGALGNYTNSVSSMALAIKAKTLMSRCDPRSGGTSLGRRAALAPIGIDERRRFGGSGVVVMQALAHARSQPAMSVPAGRSRAVTFIRRAGVARRRQAKVSRRAAAATQQWT